MNGAILNNKIMITEKEYLEAQKIVDAYKEQLRIANVSNSVSCENCKAERAINYSQCCKSDSELLCDCKKHSIKTNYGFEICTKCGNEWKD